MAAPIPPGNIAAAAQGNNPWLPQINVGDIYQRISSWMPGPAQKDAISRIALASMMTALCALAFELHDHNEQECYDWSHTVNPDVLEKIEIFIQQALKITVCKDFKLLFSGTLMLGFGMNAYKTMQEIEYCYAIWRLPAYQKEEVFQSAQAAFANDMDGVERANIIRETAIEVRRNTHQL